jgi:hypothetical protein
MEGRGAKITEHGPPLATMQDVVGVEIAVIDALRVQVAGHRGDSPGDAQSRIRGGQGIRGVTSRVQDSKLGGPARLRKRASIKAITSPWPSAG